MLHHCRHLVIHLMVMGALVVLQVHWWAPLFGLTRLECLV